ncbi:hypothetical protein L218DRAFT_1006646 [Marasmius fiardii PR-910]|nr:hypothetical protein L218DRAFT_1006646 [Marasmius fiardii PR-910]
MTSLNNINISKNGKFTLRTLLKGHKGAVAALAAHPSGTFIASGGKQGMLIRCLAMKGHLLLPTRATNHGATLAITWITRSDDPNDRIAFRTAQGFLCIWRRTKGEEEFQEIFCSQVAEGVDGQEISAIVYNTKSNQLAVAHRSEVVHQFVINLQMRPTNIKSVKVVQHCFWMNCSSGTGDLTTHQHVNRHILNEAGKVIKTKMTGIVMGHTTINICDDIFIIDNAVQGVALYKLGNTDQVKTFQIPMEEHWSRNACFLSDGSIIVTGSDHGKVYAFERHTGDIYDVINIDVEIDGVSVVIIGRSGDNVNKTELEVWERENGGPSSETECREKEARGGSWLQLVCVLLSILFVLQNVLGLPTMHWIHQQIIGFVVEDLPIEWMGGMREKPQVHDQQAMIQQNM